MAPSTPRGGTRPGARDDDGSASLFVVLSVVALMLAVGLVVDGGHKVQALQHADALAEQAARAASQQIVAAPSVRGQAPRLDAVAAEAAVQDYLARTGDVEQRDGVTVTGNGTADGAHVEVDVTVTEPTVFLAAIGITTVSATAHAEARLARGLDQEVP